MTEGESARVFSAFGPNVPDEQQLARRRQNPDIHDPAWQLIEQLNILDQLSRIDVPTLVSVGELDPVTLVTASHEIVEALRDGIPQLEVIDGAGHFPWLDARDRYWPMIIEFIDDTVGAAG